MDKYTNKEIIDFASQVGRLLVRYGAETTLAVDMVQKIARHYGNKTFEISTVGNSFFITPATLSEEEKEQGKEKGLFMSLVRQEEPNLNYVAKLTELCRRITKDELSLEDAKTQLAEIRETRPTPVGWRALAAAFGGAAMCGVIGGDWVDLGAVALAVLFTFAFKEFLTKKLSKLFGMIATTVIAATVSLFIFHMGLGNNPVRILIATCITIVPIVALMNSLKDLFKGEYVVGFSQLAHALIMLLIIFGGAVLAVNILDALVFDPEFTQPFTADDSYSFGVMRKVICAFIAPLALAAIYSIPTQHLWYIGGIGLFTYLIENFCSEVMASFFRSVGEDGSVITSISENNMYLFGIFLAICFAYILAAMMSRMHNAPTTTFLASVILTMIPGTELFWSVYYAGIGKFDLSTTNSFQACSLLITIALGLLVGMELHKAMFNKRKHFVLS